jgi:GTP 3',8-cyclase
VTAVTDLPLPRLAGGAADFARRGGQLRVSFTPRCQLGCWFCHNEGEVPPRITHHDRAIQPRPRAMTADAFLTAITAMTTAGIRRVFFTGGEPLLSPLARPVLEGVLAHNPGDYTTTLITNGLTLTRDLQWLAATSLDRIKVSLHYFSDESIAVIAEGKPGDVATIKAGIEAAVKVIPAVEVNMLLQEQNAHEVHDIIAYARDVGVSVQIIELVGTDANAGLGCKIPSADITAWLRTIATSEQVITSGTGQASAYSPWTRSPSRSSTPASAAIMLGSAAPVRPGTGAPRGSGHCAWTPSAPSLRACSALTCGSMS